MDIDNFKEMFKIGEHRIQEFIDVSEVWFLST